MKVSDIHHISVSQIRTLLRNPRKWAMEKLAKLPTCGSPQIELGKTIHEGLERLAGGDMKVLAEAEPFYKEIYEHVLEKAEPHIMRADAVEQEINIDNSAWGLPPILGYIDAIHFDYNNSGPVLVDYKTSRTRRYFLDEDGLKRDIQLMVYAYWAFTETDWGKDLDEISVGHVQIAYSLKLKKVVNCFVTLNREDVCIAYSALMEQIKPVLTATVEAYTKHGLAGLSAEECDSCNNAFGRDSCEFYGVCCGRYSDCQYKDAYKKLEEKGPVGRLELNEELTENEFSAIIKESKESDNMWVVSLTSYVNVAREQFGNITNTWDRREAMTKAVVKALKKDGATMVILPSHFISGSLDPDYMPIVTQLKELGIKTAVEL